MSKGTYIDATFNPEDKKSKLLFFAGGVRHNDKEYSGGGLASSAGAGAGCLLPRCC
jgi:hypothetical protein